MGMVWYGRLFPWDGGKGVMLPGIAAQGSAGV